MYPVYKFSGEETKPKMTDGFFPALFKHVIMVDSRFSRKISPAALLEDYNSAGENVENVKAMS